MKRRIVFAVVTAGISLVSGMPMTQVDRFSPADIYPHPAITPGATNPDITQQKIQNTIFSPRWSTKLIRPPAQYTSRLKRKQLQQYGDTVHQTRSKLINPNTGRLYTTRCVPHSDNMACYEKGHLIPLEDGGNPTEARNLWIEAYNTRVAGTIMGRTNKI